MKNKSLMYIIFVILVATSMLLSSCGGAKPSATPTVQSVATQPPTATKKVVTIIFPQEFDTLGPLYTDMWFAWTTWQLYLAWAWEFDENNEPFPKLVTEIPSIANGGISSDGTIITMKLRNDIKWSDNTPITADDFIFTWEMAVSPKNTVSSAYPYDHISSVTAPDPQTVVITFKDPFAPWLASIWHGILPKHILGPIYDSEGTIDNAAWLKNPTVGCGPFVLAKWESGSYARFVRNDNYWGTPAKVDEIFIRFVPDAQKEALQAGDADLGTYIPYSDVPALKASGLNIVTEPNGYNEGLFFLDDSNGKLGNPGLRDVKVRKAILLAIDRNAINRDLHFGLTNVPASFWDALPYYNNPPLVNYPYDPELAKGLLDQAGWIDSNGDGVREKDGVNLELSYGTSISKDRQDTQAVIKQDLAAVGVKVNIQSLDADIFLATYGEGGPAATGKIDIMEWSDGPVFPDADIYYWLCSEIPSNENPQGSNWFYTCDQQLNDLITLQSTQVDATARQKTISEINQLFYDKVYWLGLWQDPDVYAIGPRLKGIKFSGVTPFFNVVDWDIVNP
jgi:peptide/nickel transport system substrate-binding protein